MNRCLRCQGCLVYNYEDWYCINCGAHPQNTPVNPPIMVDEARRWLSILCGKCHVRNAVRGHDTCRACAHGRGPGARTHAR